MVKKRSSRSRVVIVEEKVGLLINSTYNLLVTLAVLSFAFGFALFVTVIIRLLEFDSVWVSLFLSVALMVFPVVLGVWRFRYMKKRIMHNFKRLKID